MNSPVANFVLLSELNIQYREEGGAAGGVSHVVKG